MDQNEIDALMNESPDPEEGGGTTRAENGTPAASEESGAGFSGLSQADVDAALSENNAAAAAAPAPAENETPATEAGFSDEAGFSQADIDALMSGEQPAVEDDASAAPEAVEPMLDSEGKPMDEFAQAMAEAMAEEKASQPAPPAVKLPLEEVQLPSFEPSEIASEMTQSLSLLHDVDLHVRIELGRTRMFVEDVLRLGEGSVVELDRLAGDPVDVYVNGRLVARGEVLVLNDSFCVRINEIISDPEARLVG